MGKRKSKIAKQKQVRSTKHLAKAFAKKLGVSSAGGKAFSGGGGGVGGIQDATIPSKNPFANDHATAAVQHQQQQQHKHNNNNSIKNQKKKLMEKRKWQRQMMKKKAASTVGPNNDEQAEFRRQEASLVEREMVMEWKRNTPSRRKGGQSSRNPSIILAPASFAVTDAEKGTQQLVHEVAAQVESLGGIGSRIPQRTIPLSTMMGNVAASSLAAAAAWTMDTTDTVTQNNPWAVLEQEDEEVAPMQPAQPSLNPFQFAPATFAVGIDVDPDL